MKCTADN